MTTPKPASPSATVSVSFPTPIHLVCSADSMRYGIRAVSVQGTHAFATDGHILACAPCDVDPAPSAPLPLIPSDAVASQRRASAKARPAKARPITITPHQPLSVPTLVKEGKTAIVAAVDYEPNPGNLPPVTSVLPDLAEYRFACALNPALLLTLADALGRVANPTASDNASAVLLVHTDPGKPIVVLAGSNAFGIQMPCIPPMLVGPSNETSAQRTQRIPEEAHALAVAALDRVRESLAPRPAPTATASA